MTTTLKTIISTAVAFLGTLLLLTVVLVKLHAI